MNNYFSLISKDYWTAKNSLETIVKALFRTKERYIIPEDKIEIFIAEIKDQVRNFNNVHNRCKPLVVEEWPSYNLENGDRLIEILGVTVMILYKVKQ